MFYLGHLSPQELKNNQRNRSMLLALSSCPSLFGIRSARMSTPGPDCASLARWPKFTSTSKHHLQLFVVPNCHFNHIHVNLIGLLLPSQGCSYLFTIVDHFTYWPEAILLTNSSATSCACTLVSQWVTCFGIPSMVSSDRGMQFTSALWAALSILLSTAHIRTTTNHPQVNGLVEHFHRTLKVALCMKLTDPNWVDELPWVLLGVCTAYKI